MVRVRRFKRPVSHQTRSSTYYPVLTYFHSFPQQLMLLLIFMLILIFIPIFYYITHTYTIDAIPPYLVYSYGLGADWSFDNHAETMGCQVHGFDPSGGLIYINWHQRQRIFLVIHSLVTFHIVAHMFYLS